MCLATARLSSPSSHELDLDGYPRPWAGGPTASDRGSQVGPAQTVIACACSVVASQKNTGKHDVNANALSHCIYEFSETQSNSKDVQSLQGIDVCLGHRVQMKCLILDAQSQVVGWMRIRHARDTLANNS